MNKSSQSIISNQNIGANYVLVHTYTGTALVEHLVRCNISNILVTGTSDITYYGYITIQSLGSGSSCVGIPMTSGGAPSGTSGIFFTSVPIPLEIGDVLKVYIKSGQVADNSAYIKTVVFNLNYSTLTQSDILNDANPFAGANIAAIKAKTDGLNFTGTDVKATLDGETVTVGTNNDKTDYRLSAVGVDDVLDEAVDGTRGIRQLLRLIASTLFGKSSGGNTTNPKFRNLADTKNRIDATVDASGNRTSVTLDDTA